MRRKFTSIALSGLLVLSLGGGLVPSAALAAATDTGSITIERVTGQNENVRYLGYKIFDTTVNDDGTVSEVEWVNDNVKNAVEGVIKKQDSTYSGTDPQDAAVWINQHITGTTQTTIVEANSIANAIAKAVSSLTQTVTVTPGTANTQVTHGYWLFLTSASSTDPSEGNNKVDTVGTAPIFTIIGSTPVSVNEKTTVPSITKNIVSDATGDEGVVADSQAGQNVTFKLRGTLPNNLATYGTYYYEFQDTLADGLTYVDGSARVYLVDQTAAGTTSEYDVTSSFTVTGPMLAQDKKGGGVLSVKSEDVKTIAKGYPVTGGVTSETETDVKVTRYSTFRVEYQAKINGDAMQGNTGNENSAKLVYSNNPRNTSHGDSTPAKTKDYTYEFKIHKVDNETKRSLAGAKFTIQATTPDDTASTGKYVQQDGTLGDTAYEFTTDDKGMIDVTGLDAGTYTVTETSAATAPETTSPSSISYDKIKPFTFTIVPTYDETGTLTALNSTITGGTLDTIATDTTSYVDAGIDVNGDGVIDSENEGNGYNEKLVSASRGNVQVTVRNRMRMTMPLTGQQGIALAAVAGIALITVSVVALNRRRRRDQEQA